MGDTFSKIDYSFLYWLVLRQLKRGFHAREGVCAWSKITTNMKELFSKVLAFSLIGKQTKMAAGMSLKCNAQRVPRQRNQRSANSIERCSCFCSVLARIVIGRVGRDFIIWLIWKICFLVWMIFLFSTISSSGRLSISTSCEGFLSMLNIFVEQNLYKNRYLRRRPAESWMGRLASLIAQGLLSAYYQSTALAPVQNTALLQLMPGGLATPLPKVYCCLST